MRPRTRLSPLVACLAAACASAPRGEDIDVVRRLAAPHLGEEVPLGENRPGTEAEEEIGALLAQPLTAESAVRIALLGNRDLRARLAQLGVSRGELLQSRLVANPVLEVETRLGGEVEVEFGLSQDFASLFLLGHTGAASEASLAAERARVAEAVLDLAWRVRRTFRRLQVAQERLALVQTIAETTGASAEMAVRLREAGNIPELDMLSHQAVHADARMEAAAAMSSVRVLREQLNALLGLWGERAGWTFETALPELPAGEPTPERLEQRAVEASLALATRQARLNEAAARVALERNQAWLQGLSLGAVAEHEDGGWKAGPTVSATLPLWSFNQGRVAAAEASLRAAQQAYHARAVELRAAVRAARDRLVIARERARYASEVVLPLRSRLVAETLRQFNAMKVPVFQLLDARRQEIEATRRRVETLLEYWLARSDLEQLLAGGMPRGAFRSEADLEGDLAPGDLEVSP